jgi:hypothetical protein
MKVGGTAGDQEQIFDITKYKLFNFRCGEWHFNRLFRKIILSRGSYDIGIYMKGYHLRKVVMMVKPAKNLLATFNPRFD